MFGSKMVLAKFARKISFVGTLFDEMGAAGLGVPKRMNTVTAGLISMDGRIMLKTPGAGQPVLFSVTQANDRVA